MESAKVRLKLLAAAEKAKKTLSPQGVTEARINLESLMDDFDFSIALLAEEYEKLSAPLLARLAKPIQLALEEAKLTSADLASVEIVGGSTRIGCVKRELIKILGQNMSTTMNADEAVARGAALQSAILSPRFKVLPYEIQEAQPYPIKISWDEEVGGAAQQGVEVDGDVEGSNLPTNSVVMFDRGLNFPIVRRVTLRRSGDFVVKAAYDESAVPFGFPESALREIATFKIKMPVGEDKKVRVNVKQDIHGIITLSSAQMVEEIEEEPTEVEAKEGEEPKEGEKKKKIKKTNLEFTLSRPLSWTKGEIEKAYEAEVAMSNTDRVYRETSDMRNELESYVYDMRDKIISDSQLAPFCTADEKTKFSAALEGTENWLYEDGFDATKSVYADKLAELKKIGGPIEQRQFEAQSRTTAVASLQGTIERYKTWLNESMADEKYAHITDEERQACHAKCDEVSGWLYGMLDKQGSLPQNVDAVLKVADIHTKNSELTKVCNPVMLKPAPKVDPPKVEPPKKDEPMADAAAPGDNKAEPMETEKPPGNGTEPVEMEMD
jgi:heat shock protein 4